MKGFLILMVAGLFSIGAFGQQDSISHSSCKGKKSAIHKLVQGNWVNIKDTNYILIISKNKVKYTWGLYGKIDTAISKYTLRYLDTSMHHLEFDMDFADWLEGYCFMPPDRYCSPLFKIYSVSEKFLQIDNKGIIYRRKK